MTRSCARSCRARDSNDTPADLVEFDGLEQCLEIALTETLVSLALDDLEEDRPDDVRGEDLQQDAFGVRAIAVDEDAPPAQLIDALVMSCDAFFHALVIGVGRVLELDAAAAQHVHRPVDVVRR